MVSRIVRQAGADVAHRSATWEGDYPFLSKIAQQCDRVLVVFRDPYAILQSQDFARDPHGKLMAGYQALFWMLCHTHTPLYVITYEQLILNPDSLDWILRRWGLNPDAVSEEIRDENAKYYKLCRRGPYTDPDILNSL